MKDICFPLGVMALLCFLSPFCASPSRGAVMASVHVLGVNAYGNAIGAISVDSFTDSRGKDWSDHFSGGLARDLPLGRYHLEAYHSGLHCEMNVEVSSQDSWITAAFEAPVIEAETRLLTTVSGRVSGMVGGDGTLCRLEGLYLQLRYETALKVDGAFDFGLVAPGTFIFSCFKGGQVLLLRATRIEGGQPPLVVESDRRER